MVYKPQINNGNTLNNGDSENGSTPNPAPLGEGEWLEMQPRLATMSSEQLIATVRRFACQCGVVALMTKEETAQAMRDVLAETALRPISPGLDMKADIKARLEAIDKWLDREEGKPTQKIQQNTTFTLLDLVTQAYQKPSPLLDDLRQSGKLIDVTPE